MKHSQGYTLDTLLTRFSPIRERVANASIDTTINVVERKCLIQDANGNTIPDHPGEVIPIQQLPADHPAIKYLTLREFSIPRLVEQFRITFCAKEAPESRELNRFHRNMCGGFKDTPQNRIIFYADVGGVQLGWQARIIDHTVGDIRYYLHPYTNQWVAVEQRQGSKWKCILDDRQFPWKPSKYKSAYSCQRNSLLFGYDSAVAWNNRQIEQPARFAFLSEGPGDIGRYGSPGIAVAGKFLSPEQASLIIRSFDFIVFLRQSVKDDSNDKLRNSINNAIGSHRRVYSIVPPQGKKDAGEMTDSEASVALIKLIGEIADPKHKQTLFNFFEQYITTL